MTTITIKAGRITLRAALGDSAAAREFARRQPFTVTMRDEPARLAGCPGGDSIRGAAAAAPSAAISCLAAARSIFIVKTRRRSRAFAGSSASGA